MKDGSVIYEIVVAECEQDGEFVDVVDRGVKQVEQMTSSFVVVL